MAKSRKRGRGGGAGTILLVGGLLIVGVVVADFTVLKGKIGIANILEKTFKGGLTEGGNFQERARLEVAQKQLAGTKDRDPVTGAPSPITPASNFARHSFYSIRDRISLSS